MIQGKFSIQINEKITDEIFMEYCLNIKASGYNPMVLIGFYTLGKSWSFSKLLFLQNELRTIKVLNR